VLDAFTSGRPASSKKLHSDGKVLDGLWMGGNKIAEWKNGKVVIRQITSRSEQTVARALKRMTPKKLLAAVRQARGGDQELQDLQEDLERVVQHAKRKGLDVKKEINKEFDSREIRMLGDDIKKVTSPKPEPTSRQKQKQQNLQSEMEDLVHNMKQQGLKPDQIRKRLRKDFSNQELRMIGRDALQKAVDGPKAPPSEPGKVDPNKYHKEHGKCPKGYNWNGSKCVPAGSASAATGDQDAYRKYFEEKLKKYKVKSPDDLSEEDKPKFFEEVDKGWTSQQEKKGALNPNAKIGDLSREQQIVLWATTGYKASYPPYGKNNRLYEAWEATGITPEEYNKAQKELVTHKVLRSNGSLTPAAKKLLKGQGLAQHALKKLAKPGWSPSHDDRSKMEDQLSQGAARQAGPWDKALVLQKHPSGNWGFVGSVPVPLYWERKDGKPISPEEAKDLTQSSNPSMFAKTRGIKQRVFKSKEEALKAAKKLKAKVTQVSEGAKKQAQKPKPKKLTPAIRNKIAKDMKKVGLDGNGRFRKPEEGYSKAVDVLSKYGIELDGIPDSHRFKGDKGSVSVDLAWSNKEDPFSPVSMNSMLAVSFYKLENDKYEVLAYVT
jgi:hypothetical protein